MMISIKKSCNLPISHVQVGCGNWLCLGRVWAVRSGDDDGGDEGGDGDDK